MDTLKAGGPRSRKRYLTEDGDDEVSPRVVHLRRRHDRWRPWIAVGAVAGVCALLFAAYRLGASRAGSAAAPAVSSKGAVAARHVLLLCPVCKRAVDPSTAPCVLEFGSKSIYFDSMGCLNAFRADPVKYGAGRIKLHVGFDGDASSQTDAQAKGPAPTPADATTLDESPPHVDDDAARTKASAAGASSADAQAPSDDAPGPLDADSQRADADGAAPVNAEKPVRTATKAAPVSKQEMEWRPNQAPVPHVSAPQNTGAQKKDAPAASASAAPSKSDANDESYDLPPGLNDGPPHRTPDH